MKRIWFRIAACTALLSVLVACERETATASPAPEPVATEQEDDVFVPGEMVVELTDEMTAQIEKCTPEEAGALLGVISAERLYADAGEWEPRHREAGLHRWYRLSYDPEHISATKASDEVALIPGVRYSEPVRRIKPTAIFNDPDLDKQWHYINTGLLTSDHKAGCDINVQPVWENFTAGSSTVIVEVVDGGIDMSHYDLAEVISSRGISAQARLAESMSISPSLRSTRQPRCERMLAAASTSRSCGTLWIRERAGSTRLAASTGSVAFFEP